MTPTMPWATLPTPAPWRLWLAARLRRAADALTCSRRPRHLRAAAPPQMEFHQGVLYVDGVRIGTLPVTRL